MENTAPVKKSFGAAIAEGSKSFLKSRQMGLLAVLIAVIVILSIASDNFLVTNNIFNILKQVSIVTILACGQTFVIISGGIDLSIGYILGISSIALAYLLSSGVPVGIAIVAAICVGGLFGVLNGYLITKLKLPPFIVTLGMASITRGLALALTKGFPISIKSPAVIALGQGYIKFVPIMVIVMLIVVWIMNYTLQKSVFGTRLKAVGGNEEAALLSGVNVRKTKVLIYGVAGLLAGVGAIIITGRLNAGNPNAGLNFEMNSIAATIIGGTSLSGGTGNIVGTMIGALLLGVVSNGLVLLNVNMYWQTVITGIIIISVCALDRLTSMRKSKKAKAN